MNDKITPPLLQKGDTVAIVAPSGKLPLPHLNEAVALLESWGLTVELGKYLWENEHMFSASDTHRAEDFQQALDNPTIKAIFCARGGYGATRIIDSLDFTSFTENPKWVIGFSDITAFHTHIFSFGFQSLHACMPAQYNGRCTYQSVESLRQSLFETPVQLKALPHAKNRLGKTEGILVGGNLSLLNDVVGTKSDFATEGNILFVEEINEPLYNIDRMFTHLKRLGKLEKLNGVIVGDFDVKCNEGNEFGLALEDIILEKVAEYKYPVAFNFPFGHRQHNLAIVSGANVNLSVTAASSTLSYAL